MKKEESGALQGIAVLLMIFHHCFLYPSMFLDGFLRNANLTSHIAASARIAIAICAFVSGYGIFHVLKKNNGYKAEYPAMLKRILKLYGRYWFAVVITVIVELIIAGGAFAWNELPGNLTAFNPTYNSTWWYVREYMFMLLLAPLLKSALQGEKNRRLSLLIPVLILLFLGVSLIVIPDGKDVLLSLKEYVQVVLLFVFFEGYLAAFLQDKLKDRAGHKETDRKLMIAAGLIIILAACVGRFMLTKDGGDSKPDMLIAPVFVFAAVLILRNVGPLRTFLGFLGRNLLYIWFIHGLIWKHTFVFLTSKTGPLIYYLTIVISSLLVSIVLTRIESTVTGMIIKKAGNSK